jgi:hypothetical protein
MRVSIKLALCALVGLASSPVALAMPFGYVVIAGSSNPPPARCLTRSLSGGALYGRNPQAIGPDGTRVGSAPIGTVIAPIRIVTLANEIVTPAIETVTAPIETVTAPITTVTAPIELDSRICGGRLCP